MLASRRIDSVIIIIVDRLRGSVAFEGGPAHGGAIVVVTAIHFLKACYCRLEYIVNI